jgi:DNA-binding CsgD family transcriptional regulator
MNKYYIYGHVDPRYKNEIFYIGKGVRGRACSLSNRNKQHLNKLKKILSEGYNIDDIVVYLEDNITDEIIAYNKESDYIKNIGLENLLNAVPGGKGGWSYFRKDVDENTIINYLKSGLDLKDIAHKIGYNVSGIKKRFFPNCSLYDYCKKHNIAKFRPMAKHIDEDEYVKLLSEGRKNKDIARILNINENTIKLKFYPKSTLKQFCEKHNIIYHHTQTGNKNGNYKMFPKERFVKLIKEGAGLTLLEKELGLSKRCLIAKYREEFNVSNWKELLEKIT